MQNSSLGFGTGAGTFRLGLRKRSGGTYLHTLRCLPFVVMMESVNFGELHDSSGLGMLDLT